MATRGRGRGRGRGPIVKSEPDVGVSGSPLASGPAPVPSPAPGVKKFEPKVAPRRAKKSEVKSETGEVDAAHIQKLIQDAQDAAANRRGFRANENRVATTRVAFGSGSGAAAATRIPAGFAKRSSSGTGSGGGGGGGAGGANAGWRGPDKKPEVDPQTGEAQERAAKTRVGIFDSVDDSSSYKPISLPLRRPPGVGTEFSDDEDDDDAPDKVLEENMVPPAKELGLETESPGERLLFLQLPSVLPASNGQASVTSLDELPAGLMGKLRIHESGAIKLHLGKTVMDVYPGTRCVFAQEVVAINSSTKKCAFLGDVGQRLVVTPDIGGLFTDHAK